MFGFGFVWMSGIFCIRLFFQKSCNFQTERVVSQHSAGLAGLLVVGFQKKILLCECWLIRWWLFRSNVGLYTYYSGNSCCFSSSISIKHLSNLFQNSIPLISIKHTCTNTFLLVVFFRLCAHNLKTVLDTSGFSFRLSLKLQVRFFQIKSHPTFATFKHEWRSNSDTVYSPQLDSSVWGLWMIVVWLVSMTRFLVSWFISALNSQHLTSTSHNHTQWTNHNQPQLPHPNATPVSHYYSYLGIISIPAFFSFFRFVPQSLHSTLTPSTAGL